MKGGDGVAAVLLIVGVALVVAGVAWVFVPAALIVAGLVCVVASVDLTRRPRRVAE